MQKQVGPVHFEDFSGEQFERLCFAYLVRDADVADVDWYGQLGGDGGRDIVATAVGGAVVIHQCANYARLTFAKAQKDLTKLAAGPKSAGSRFRMIAGGKVSGALKTKIKEAAERAGFVHAEIWSGSELEERIRKHAPDLLRRFVGGEAFPETPEQLRSFSKTSAAATDEDIIAALVRCFDRPAFRTHFHQESSLPRFKLALGETIDALNTGRLPNGALIPSRHQVKNAEKHALLAKLVEEVVGLRAAFDQFLRNHEIRPCGCNQPDCPIFMLSPAAAQVMDDRRRMIFASLRQLDSTFTGDFYRL